MKRKSYYLFALALPALLAGCQQEELVSNSANNDGMKLLENPIENFSLKVETSDDVQTRMTDGAQFEAGDEMGLVWFNPWYLDNQWVGGSSQDVWEQLDRPQFYANNRMTINAEADGSGVWTSDAVIMEGTHFAYFPFQTKWGDEYLQVKGGKEILKVYNAETQPVDVNDRLDWLMNHQTLLSPVYEFTEDNGGAGISEERAIRLELFSNRLNIQPVFENFPSDLTVHSFELKTVGNLNQGRYTAYDAFVTEAEILANKLPMSADFGGCNWATIGNPAISLADFYAPTKLTNSLTIEYTQDVTVTDDMDRFTFLLLPVNAANMPSKSWWTATASEIQLVAHTNYGDITINTVNGIFNANMTTKSDITLSQLYYNAENGDQVAAADQFVGLVGNAGTTRGGSATGSNNNKLITATFDFNDITFTLPEVCSNATLERALNMIKRYKNKLGDACPEKFTLQLCKQPVFTDLDFTGTLNDFMEETGLEISVTGYNTWTDEDGTLHTYSEITWKGNSKLDQVIHYTENFVADGATLTTNSEKKIVKITVLDGGKLANKGLVSTVMVEEGGSATNDGTITSVTNYGKVTNNQAVSAAEEDQPTITRLYNYNSVVNYATLSDVKSNVKADGTAATIELRDNTKKVGLGTLGSIFVVKAENAEVEGKLGIIKYDLDSATAADAGTDLAHALNNYATQITVDAAVTEIEAPESATFQNANGRKNDFDRAQITFEGNTEYSIDNKTATGSELALGEIVLKDGVTLTVSNAYYTGNNSGATESAYALVADDLTMGNNATVDVKEITSVVAKTLNIADGVTATVKTVAGKEMLSAFYYGTQFGDGTLTTSGNINTNIPTDCNKYFR